MIKKEDKDIKLFHFNIEMMKSIIEDPKIRLL
jgi:hypothetical protein